MLTLEQIEKLPEKELIKLTEEAMYRIKLSFMMKEGTTFLSSLLASLTIRYMFMIPTAGTDGVILALNPQFVLQQTQSQLLGLIVHEVMHVMYDDMGRRKEMELNKAIFNIACDHRINLHLLSEKYELPDNGHADPKYRNWSAMQIYDDLMKDPPPQAEQDAYDIDILEGPEEGETTEDGMTSDDHREQVISNILKATQEAELAGEPGSIPADVRRYIDDLINPKLPWNAILQNQMQAYNQDDYSWTRPNKRYMPEFYLPSLHSEGLGQITWINDVSGSMGKQDLTKGMSELNYIWEVMKPTRLRLMSVDTEVHDDDLYFQGDTLDEVKLHGGGGTNITPAIARIVEEQPEVAIIFSDGYFYMPDLSQTVATDIIWIVINNPGFTAPRGTVIHYDK